MFDISFGKLAILFALCLIVLGPEKLPKLAQQLGRWTGQARAMARHFRAQLEQEIATEQLMKEKRELEAAVKRGIDDVSAPINTIGETVEEAKKSVTLPEFDPGASNDSGHGDYDPLAEATAASSDAVSSEAASTEAEHPVATSDTTTPDTTKSHG